MSKLYIPSTLNIYLILWHKQLIVCPVNDKSWFKSLVISFTFQGFFWMRIHSKFMKFSVWGSVWAWKVKWITHDLNHDLTFYAHSINYVCHSIRSMFRVLGIYNFDQWQKVSGKNIHIYFFNQKPKLYIPSTLNIDLILWHT